MLHIPFTRPPPPNPLEKQGALQLHEKFLVRIIFVIRYVKVTSKHFWGVCVCLSRSARWVGQSLSSPQTQALCLLLRTYPAQGPRPLSGNRQVATTPASQTRALCPAAVAVSTEAPPGSPLLPRLCAPKAISGKNPAGLTTRLQHLPHLQRCRRDVPTRNGSRKLLQLFCAILMYNPTQLGYRGFGAQLRTLAASERCWDAAFKSYGDRINFASCSAVSPTTGTSRWHIRGQLTSTPDTQHLWLCPPSPPGRLRVWMMPEWLFESMTTQVTCMRALLTADPSGLSSQRLLLRWTVSSARLARSVMPVDGHLPLWQPRHLPHLVSIAAIAVGHHDTEGVSSQRLPLAVLPVLLEVKDPSPKNVLPLPGPYLCSSSHLSPRRVAEARVPHRTNSPLLAAARRRRKKRRPAHLSPHSTATQRWTARSRKRIGALKHSLRSCVHSQTISAEESHCKLWVPYRSSCADRDSPLWRPPFWRVISGAIWLPLWQALYCNLDFVWCCGSLAPIIAALCSGRTFSGPCIAWSSHMTHCLPCQLMLPQCWEREPLLLAPLSVPESSSCLLARRDRGPDWSSVCCELCPSGTVRQPAPANAARKSRYLCNHVDSHFVIAEGFHLYSLVSFPSLSPARDMRLSVLHPWLAMTRGKLPHLQGKHLCSMLLSLVRVIIVQCLLPLRGHVSVASGS